HVAWDIPVEPSMRKAAETLAAIQQEPLHANQPVHVFSTGLDFTAYCAWFAPGVKGFLDTRYNLYATVAPEYAKAKVALFEKNRPTKDWASVFSNTAIDYVAVEGFINSAFVNPYTWWDEPQRWKQQFADKNIAVFAWSRGKVNWPSDAVLDEWNRLAFGPQVS